MLILVGFSSFRLELKWFFSLYFGPLLLLYTSVAVELIDSCSRLILAALLLLLLVVLFIDIQFVQALLDWVYWWSCLLLLLISLFLFLLIVGHAFVVVCCCCLLLLMFKVVFVIAYLSFFWLNEFGCQNFKNPFYTKTHWLVFQPSQAAHKLLSENFFIKVVFVYWLRNYKKKISKRKLKKEFCKK